MCKVGVMVLSTWLGLCKLGELASVSCPALHAGLREIVAVVIIVIAAQCFLRSSMRR